jgi:hypothetical protein
MRIRNQVGASPPFVSAKPFHLQSQWPSSLPERNTNFPRLGYSPDTGRSVGGPQELALNLPAESRRKPLVALLVNLAALGALLYRHGTSARERTTPGGEA